jgi:hypothetical protein
MRRDWGLTRSYEDLRRDYAREYGLSRAPGGKNRTSGNLAKLFWEYQVFGKQRADAMRREQATLGAKLNRLFR